MRLFIQRVNKRYPAAVLRASSKDEAFAFSWGPAEGALVLAGLMVAVRGLKDSTTSRSQETRLSLAHCPIQSYHLRRAHCPIRSHHLFQTHCLLHSHCQLHSHC